MKKQTAVLTYAQACMIAARAFADVKDGQPVPGFVSSEMVAAIYNRELAQVRADIRFIQDQDQQAVGEP